ncbi:hypothetical protein [Jidongwangia harbinensis]|uniref:hypothetical protein n=1 Tax=Jidongwangia harbinensis TaxID=2878561 RepID=UPI001CDA3C1B|nr:hypothetical protein [Jidongwangia harbinensis]MCA2217448.1 hypothetical protein [Jidongwangia harbinensis]
MRGSAPTVTIGKHTVGNALVLHARERISSEAQSLALAVAHDAENEIVVLDLHDDLPAGIWESVAGALHRRRRGGIRLIVCGARQDTSVLAGQWLSDRLGCPVVAPYGQMIRGSSGTLFVHAAEGSGWLRYNPRRPPRWEAKRYPRPDWDVAAAEFLPTSAHGAVEPLPAGVWIRDGRDDASVRAHWQMLASSVPCQPHAFTVVLGCPGTPPLPLDDVARFWRAIGGEGRGQARFVQYGPVQLPEGEVLGQALADLLETRIACFTGVPVGKPERPRIHTVDDDGALGWQVLVRELGYLPRAGANLPTPLPQILSYRAPTMLGEAAGPRVYRYADDAVVEIVQSGLWLRDAAVPRYADRIRARVANPRHHALIVDDAEPARVARLRELAEDLAARLDPATRDRCTLHLASALVPATPRVASAAGELTDGLTYRFSAADLALDEALAAVAPPAGEVTGLAVPAPEVKSLGSGPRGRAGGNMQSAPAPASAPKAPETHDLPSRVLPPPGAGRVAESPLWEEPVAPVSPAVLSAAPNRARLEPAAPPHAADPVPMPQAREPDENALPFRVAPTAHRPRRHSEPPVPPPDTAERVLVALDRARPRDPMGFQVEPDPDARGLPTPAGLAEERAWLRGALSGEFDAAASSVSRVLSEHPGFQAAPETMVDAVAVRLYLSAVGDRLDEALRDGDVGPQVPFARCVAAGLRRLPSHRGATSLVAELPAEDVARIRDRGVLTDWGFTHALTDPPLNLLGDVDVLIWSMTARRTRLLEPDDDHWAESRVVFLPGTSFKVLDAVLPGPGVRGRLLLRELAADEPDRGRVPLDDLALNSLSRAMERAGRAGTFTRVGAAAASRFQTVPGLRR